MILAAEGDHARRVGRPTLSTGFFPAEMCFSERMIPVLVDEGIAWIDRARPAPRPRLRQLPLPANLDNCDPPNRADQVNPAQGELD